MEAKEELEPLVKKSSVYGERYGVEKLIREIQEELKTNSYGPQPLKRVYILKADGKKRPLGYQR